VDMHARGMKTLVHENALIAVVLAGMLAFALAAGATLIATGSIGLGLSDTRTAAPAHGGPTTESIQFVEENVFSVSGAYIGSTTAEQIQFLEENVFSESGAYAAPMSTEQIQFLEENLFSFGANIGGTSTEAIEFLEQNTYLGGAGDVRLPHADSTRQVDY
jgi:hypothetical protein